MNEEINNHQQSEEDKLLNSIVKSILRDLQAEAAVQALDQDSATTTTGDTGDIIQGQNDKQHVNSDHTITTTLSTTTTAATPFEYNGQPVLKCDPIILTPSEFEHCKLFLEQDGDDANGIQGGQGWKYPTTNPTQGPSSSPINPTHVPSSSPTSVPSSSPTKAPSVPTASPSVFVTGEPSFHPTIHGDPFVLAGTIFYDLNGNGERDSNIDNVEFGNDVEYTYGLGGVQIQLMECDADTNTELMVAYRDGTNSYSMAVSQGVDILMKPQLVEREENGGQYNLINIKINRAYFIYVTAPEGYLLSGGVCNDDEPGWECKKSAASAFATGYNNQNRRMQRLRGLNTDTIDPDATKPTKEELELGIREGRSSKCVTIDRRGMPDQRLDIGVMRIGDNHFSDSDVELSLDLIEPDIDVRGRRGRGRRSLQEAVREEVMKRLGRDLAEQPVTMNNDGIAVYDLRDEDKMAIGVVTSEVMASNLDLSLLRKGVVLDSVSHIDVVYFAPEPEVDEDANSNSTSDGVNNSTGAATDAAEETDAARQDAPTSSTGISKTRNAGGKLEVNLVVRGHFNRNLDVDFDYIVQDSINRDAISIRRQLTTYNQNCRDQTTKVVDLGFTLNDFLEVHTNTGVTKPLNRFERQQRQGQLIEDQAFSTACNKNNVLPDYFEASLGGLKLTTKSEGTTTVNTGGTPTGAILGGIIAVGVFVFILGFFLFQRGMKKKQTKQEARVTHIVSSSTSRGSSYYTDDDLDISKESRGTFSKEESRESKERRKSMIGSGGSESGSKQFSIDYSGTSRIDYSDTSKHVITPVNQSTSQRRGLSGLLQKEYSNVAAALTSERRRLDRAGGAGPRRRSTAGTESESIHDDTEEDDLSKNAVPMIMDADFEDSSDDDSDSSSDDESSSDSSSSSSEDESQRRKQIRMSMKSKGKKKKVGKADVRSSKTKKRSKVEKGSSSMQSSINSSNDSQQGSRRSSNLV